MDILTVQGLYDLTFSFAFTCMFRVKLCSAGVQVSVCRCVFVNQAQKECWVLLILTLRSPILTVPFPFSRKKLAVWRLEGYSSVSITRFSLGLTSRGVVSYICAVHWPHSCVPPRRAKRQGQMLRKALP